MSFSIVGQKLVSGALSSVSGLTFESSLFLLNKIASPVCVFGSQNYVERAGIVFQERVGRDVACILPPQQGVLDTIDQHYFASSISTQMLGTKTKKVKLLFFDKKLIKKPLFSVNRPLPIKVFRKTGFEDLTQALPLIGFKETQTDLLPGSFSIKGGIIDLYLFNSNQIYRISFLEDFVRVFIVNKQSNKIIKEIDELKIYPKLQKDRVPFFEAFPSFFQCYNYQEGVLSCIQKPTKIKKINLSCVSIDYQNFIKNKSSKNFIFSKTIHEKGFIYKEVYYLPSWFNKNPSVSSEKSFSVESADSLRVGGIYIHEDFGFCSFLGLDSTLKSEKLCLKFADGIVKVDINYISKLSFVSLNKKSLSFLNKPAAWRRQKNTLEKKAEEFVVSLISSYIKREKSLSVKMKTQDEIIVDFVRDFPYKDTPDQALCWQNILKDLGSSFPMNRLICGDVGFGKTELAIRASFVAAINGASVAVVAPTTLLANQLYHSFVSRLTKFGVVVGCLSRLTKNKKGVVDGFLKGKKDILIGTSAVLFQKKILKCCGLFIVDEEHRFGTKNKEKVFQYTPGVNFLSLSATPIPRSMQLSLSGVRNFSLIQTPPVARKPIISSLNYFSENLVKNIIIKEISRGGQVYFVDNSVQNLKKIFKNFSFLLPSISLDIIYGSLEGGALLEKMENFVGGKTQVLFSTTIIESGIDIGSTNTIIINNAHLFGLSQLYQLRGRVGRSSVQAFAWFLFSKNKPITTVGLARLKAILKYSSLGSGYQIALSDLEIRGAGSLFGYSQSGGGAVGFEYYSKTLTSITNKINNLSPKECFVDLGAPSIPSSFLVKEQDRLFYYKKIFSCNSFEELKKVEQGVIEVFGVCIKEIKELLNNKRLSLVAAKKDIKSIVLSQGRVSVSFITPKKDPLIKNLVDIIFNFFTEKNIDFWFIKSHKNLIFQYKSLGKDDYILLSSFINKINCF